MIFMGARGYSSFNLQVYLWVFFDSKRVVVAGIVLPDAKIGDSNGLIFQSRGIFQASVKAELGSDHKSVIV